MFFFSPFGISARRVNKLSMEMESLLNGNNSVDLVKIGVCYMLQSVMAETALIALTSRLLFLVKTLPLLDANMLAYLTGTDNRFPLGRLNRLEKAAAENMDGGDAEDTESEDDDDDEDDEDDDEDDGEDDSGDEDDSDDELLVMEKVMTTIAMNMMMKTMMMGMKKMRRMKRVMKRMTKKCKPNHLPKGRSETEFSL